MAAPAATGCGEGEAPTSPDGDGGEPPTRLEVTLWPQGRDGPSRSANVTCATDESESHGCAAAADLEPEDLEPVPPNAICTQIYGGPQEARIEGRLDGEDVAAELSRRNGCEIARWERAAALLVVAERS